MDYHSIIKGRPDLFSNENALIQIILDGNETQLWKSERLKQLTEKYQPEEWAEIGMVLDDPRIVILRDLVEFPGGCRNGYIRIYNRAYLEGAAAGVAMLPEMNGNILLIHHFRHATRMFHWEIPRGFGESGVDAKTQAKNELQEEIGGEVAEIFDLGIIYNNTGLEGNPINLFLARMASVGEMEIQEGIENSKWVSISELEQMIAHEEITDGFTIASYTRAKLKKLI